MLPEMLPEILKIKSRSGIPYRFQFSERFELKCEFENEDVLFQNADFFVLSFSQCNNKMPFEAVVRFLTLYY